MALLLAVAWSSEGVRFTDLSVDQIRPFEFLIVISSPAIVWPIVAVIIYAVKQDLPAIVVLVIMSVLTFFLLVMAIVFAAGVYDLSQSPTVRSLNLNVGALEAASFFSIVGVMGYIGDMILEIIVLVIALRKQGIKKLYLGSCCIDSESSEKE
jgi:hypothetical protein